MAKIFKAKPTELDTLLKTSDSKEQVSRIKQLMNPTFTLAIQFDARTGQVSLSTIGLDIPGQIAHKMLDAARMVLVQTEAKRQKPTPPPAEPVASPPMETSKEN
jgi:hypothetical protein